MKELLFLGDVFLDREYEIDFSINDFVFNLEFPISKSGIPAKNKVNLKAEKSWILGTFKKIPKAVCLSNNHLMDYGNTAYKETIENLESKQIKYFGAGNKVNNYNNPCILNLDNKLIALLGYACPSTHPAQQSNIGVAILEKEKVLRDIQQIRKQVDFIVLQFHWGDEEIPFPKYTDVKIAHQCIEAGADLIIGHHAHVIQSYEVYKGKHIFYGLGNFIFPDLNVNAMYDGEKFTQKYIKKQNKENRRSVVVKLTRELNIEFFTVEFTKGIVKKKNINVPKWIPTSEESYRKKLLYQRKTNMLQKFIKNPKIPNIGHFKRFIGVNK